MNNVSFDDLAKKAFSPTAGSDDFEALFAATFSLPALHFIVDGQLHGIQPYCARFPDLFGDDPAVVVFTDSERAQRYVAEHPGQFESADTPVVLNSGDAQLRFSSEGPTMAVPMSGILGFLDGLVPRGIVKIFFNCDKYSQGFNHDIKMMRPIWEFLDSKGLIAKTASPDEDTAINSQPESVATADAAADFDDLSRKTNATNVAPEHFNRLFAATFALPNWLFIARGEAPNFNPYVASAAGTAEGRQMIRAFTDGKRLHRFATENGLLDASGQALTLTIPTAGVIEYLEQFEQYGVYGVWFNSDSGSDGYFTPLKQLRVIKHHLEKLAVPAETADARMQQDNLAGFGMSQTDDGGFDLNLVINKLGTVRYDASILPFYEAMTPLLRDFQGTGDFVTLLAFDPSGVSQLTENIAKNDNGPYLRSRNFQYLNPKNGVHIAVTSLHTNHLRHVRTNAELTVSVELCKNLDNQTGVLYHRFEGPRAEVLSLAAAFDPVLMGLDYEAVG
jgi:hypothetical protein